MAILIGVISGVLILVAIYLLILEKKKESLVLLFIGLGGVLFFIWSFLWRCLKGRVEI